MRLGIHLGLAILAPKLCPGDFQVLDFQSADTAHVDPATGLGSASELLPGWEVSSETREQRKFRIKAFPIRPGQIRPIRTSISTMTNTKPRPPLGA